MISFAYTILYVKNVEKAIDFYEKVFDLKRKFIAPESSYGELSTGATTLSFASHELANTGLKDGFTASDPAQKPFAMEIGFTTDNVEGLVKKAVAAGAILIEEPKTKPWGQVVAYVRDPEGFLVEICTPVVN